MSDVKIEYAETIAYWAHCSACGWSGPSRTNSAGIPDAYSTAYADKLHHQNRPCPVINRPAEATR